ncbi:hypothetical protein [Actinomadura flavalba]|uniref:hypothetical protein n=1 Tax=Actinomadura flavalba TaxID=1120938 RepID=UPI000381E4DB|nr:hypothetical protein [Actinomadura flavalba]
MLRETCTQWGVWYPSDGGKYVYGVVPVADDPGEPDDEDEPAEGGDLGTSGVDAEDPRVLSNA